MLTIDDLKRAVSDRLAGIMGGLSWRFEAMTDDPYTLAVGVFNVPAEADEAISRKILDLDWELCQGTFFGVVPMLRDPEATRKYYPQYAASGLCEAHPEHQLVPECAPASALRPDARRDGKRLPDRPVRHSPIANQELALAA